MKDLPERRCIICKNWFQPTKISNIMCLSIICKYERLQQQKTQWKKKNYLKIKEVFKCPYCKTYVKKKRYDQKTCGKKKCINKQGNFNKNLRWAKEEQTIERNRLKAISCSGLAAEEEGRCSTDGLALI